MIHFHIENEQEAIEITEELLNLMKQAAHMALVYEGLDEFEAEVDLTLTDNDMIRVLNRQHRLIDRPTDVLSFPQYEDLKNMDEVDEDLMLGDIVISVEKAKEQAAEYGHSFEREMCFLVVHSMLHLFGYDHMNPIDEEAMNELQEAILTEANILR